MITLATRTRAVEMRRGRGVRLGPVSLDVDRRTTSICALILGVAFSAFCVNIAVGDFDIPIGDVLAYLVRHGDADSRLIIGEYRIPRALTGVLVGGALGLSGAVFQAVARNPLASPDVIGVTSGASLFAVGAIVLLGEGDVIGGVAADNVPIAALAGGLVTAVAVYALAYRRGLLGYRMVLVGIGIAAMNMSIINYLLTRATIYEATKATVWLTGSLTNRGWEHVRPVAAGVLVLAPITLAQSRRLRVLQLGDDTAAALGARVESSRLVLLACAVGLAAIATASAGPVAFVAFVSPVVARRLLRNGSAALGTSMLLGALLLSVSDLIARRALPSELPVGVITALLGGPYLLWLLWRANTIGAAG